MVIQVHSEGNNILIVYHDKIESVPFNNYFYYKDEDGKGEYKSIFGDVLKKKEIPNVAYEQKKSIIDKHYSFEGDVVIEKRFLIDYFDNIAEEQLQKCYVDIETEMKGDFPDVIEAPNKIQAITVYDTKIKKYLSFVLSAKHKHDEENKIYFYDTEEKVLQAFVLYVKSYNPDIITGWNSNGFDVPYIISRMRNLHMRFSDLARAKFAWANKYKDKIRVGIGGRVCLDLMDAYKFISQGERESYSLEYISQYELNEGKDKFEGNLQELYENDIYTYIKYNRRDVELLKLLDEKLKIIEFIDTMRRYARCMWDDVYVSSKLTDAIFLKNAKNRFILPNNQWKPYEQSMKGAFVISPIAGLYHRIAVLDWKSLYPNIIRKFNLSPEKKLSNYKEDCILVKNQYISDLYFSKEMGFVPEVVGGILEEREYYKAERKKFKYDSTEYKALDMLQYAVKVAANTIFGVLKSDCRLSDPQIAEAITTMGQSIIKKAITIAEREGYKIVYGDTDSIFIDMNNKEIQDLSNLAKLITDEINEWCNKEFNTVQNTLELQFEKVFDTLIFVGEEGEEAAKKRYAGRITWKEGKIVDDINIMGFEAKRSDSPKVIREFQKNLFELVLKGHSKEEIDAFVDEFNKKFNSMHEEIGIPCGISKTDYKNVPIHIRAAKLSNERHGTKFSQGDKIKYIYVKKQPDRFKEFENVIAYKTKIPEGYEIDYERMHERLIQKKIDTVYVTLGWKVQAHSQGITKKWW